MSYDISLYVKSFLECALASNLGDWTNADPIPRSAVEAVIEAARAEGFVPIPGGTKSVGRSAAMSQYSAKIRDLAVWV